MARRIRRSGCIIVGLVLSDVLLSHKEVDTEHSSLVRQGSGALHRLVPSSGARLQSVLDQFKGATSALVSRDHCFAAANARLPSLKLGSTRTWPTEQDHSLRCGRCSLSLFW